MVDDRIAMYGCPRWRTAIVQGAPIGRLEGGDEAHIYRHCGVYLRRGGPEEP